MTEIPHMLPAETASAPTVEQHYVNRNGWLRAAVLGANDGLLSTGSLMAGVAAASIAPGQLVLTGVAGIVAGALSMATGEYVSVSSQADTEEADRQRELRALKERPQQELAELSKIYEDRGLERDLARRVAASLTRNDALDAHMRDELGVTDTSAANPIQAAGASAISFVAGGATPLLIGVLLPGPHVLTMLMIGTVVMLAILGGLGARTGGAPVLRGMIRVVTFGTLAMVVTAAVGHFFHTAA